MRQATRSIAMLLALTAGMNPAARWGAAFAQGEGYTIVVKDPGPGDTVHVAKDEAIAEQSQVVAAMNRVLQEQNRTGGEVTVYRETILAQTKEGVTTRLRRTFDKAQMREKGQLRDLAYNGKTVLIERKGNRHTFWLEGRGELTPAEAKLLDKEFNGNNERFSLRSLLPQGPVRAGDYPWTVDIKPLVRDLTRTGKIGSDPLRAKGVGRMKRVYRDEFDRLCAELSYQMEFPITMLALNGQKTPMAPGSRAIVDMTLDLCIDGSSFYVSNKDSLRIEATAPQRLPDGAVGVLTFSCFSNNQCVNRGEPK